MTPVLLLASASPARRRLLTQAAIPHRVQVSGVDEDAITDPNPLLLVQRLARAKALAVWESQRRAQLQPPSGPLDPPPTAGLGCPSGPACVGAGVCKPVGA